MTDTLLSPRRIRLKGDSLSHAQVNDSLTGARALIWRGTDVRIEVGLFVGALAVNDVSEIDHLYLAVIAGPRSSAPILELEPDASPVAITAEQWTAGTHQSAVFSLTAAQTQFDLAGATAAEEKRQCWLVVHAVLDGGGRVTCFGTQFEVEEDGAQNDLAVVPMTNPSFRIAAGILQLYNPDTALWHALYVSGAPGAETLAIGPGES